MLRVLLLNPPSPGRDILRDFACGESSKADYYWAPIDLLVLSGVFREHQLKVIDAVACRFSASEALRQATEFQPDVVFSLCAAVSLQADDDFLQELKNQTGARIFGLGDVASFEPVQTLSKTQSFDALIQNFADPSLVALAKGEREGLSGVVLRTPKGAKSLPTLRFDPLKYPLPRHELFPTHRYRLPFGRWEQSTTVLSVYGCPFPCTFCPSRHLPFQLREIADLIQELRHVQSLGIPEFYLRDFTFGPSRKRARELCEAMIDAGLKLRWSAECRLDVLDEELLELMAQAGCEVILCGIETGNAEVSSRLGKRFSADRNRQILGYARQLGIRSCAHFVLGSPGETPAQIKETIAYASSIPLDYASFNLYAARLGTDMRLELIEQGKVNEADFGAQDVSTHAQSFAQMSAKELRQLYLQAVLKFYFRPPHLLRLLKVTPWSTLLRQGTGVFRNLLDSRT